MPGLTDAGFELKRLSDIKTEIEEKLRAELGSSLNLLPESVFGQIISVFADREASVWEVAEDVYNSAYPDTASGVSLDNVVALTGITRQPAIASVQENLRLFGTAATLVPSGTVISVEGSPESRFQTDADVTLVAGQDEVQDIDFSAVPTAGAWVINFRGSNTGSLAYNANAAAVQAALNALPFGTGITVVGNYTSGFTVTFAGDAGKQEQPLLTVPTNTLVSGGPAVTVTILETTPGINQGVVNCTAEETGPVIAPAGTLNVIETPVSGLTRVINVEDATVGRNVETDLELRQRRAQTLQVAGKATPDAIRAALLEIDGVTDAFVFENDAMVYVNSRPPKSYECVVNGGDNTEILQKIWDSKPAGIEPFGSYSGLAFDSQGQSHTVSFSRPTQINIYLEVDLTTNSDFPVNGLALAEQALLDQGNAFGIGKDVIVYPKLVSALNDIPGIEDVVIRIGTAPGPTLDDNILIDISQIASFDTSRITVIEL